MISKDNFTKEHIEDLHLQRKEKQHSKSHCQSESALFSTNCQGEGKDTNRIWSQN